MKPEEKSRKLIDRQLGACGWAVQNHSEMNLSAGLGIAVREFPLKTGFADYLLYVDAKAVAVIEAKPAGHTLKGVETQSAKYTDGLPDQLPHFRLPLPFAYESTGVVTQFTNGLNPTPKSREVFTFHRPEELLRLVRRGDDQVRARLQHMPELNVEGLWPLKISTLNNLEKSLAHNRPRSLIQMATGSGKTLTAVIAAYRLIKFAKANLKRYRAAVLKAAVEGMLTEHSADNAKWLEQPYWRPIGDVIESLGQGWSPKCERTPSMDNATWGVIKTSAVQSFNSSSVRTSSYLMSWNRGRILNWKRTISSSREPDLASDVE